MSLPTTQRTKANRHRRTPPDGAASGVNATSGGPGRAPTPAFPVPPHLPPIPRKPGDVTWGHLPALCQGLARHRRMRRRRLFWRGPGPPSRGDQGPWDHRWGRGGLAPGSPSRVSGPALQGQWPGSSAKAASCLQDCTPHHRSWQATCRSRLRLSPVKGVLSLKRGPWEGASCSHGLQDGLGLKA